MGNIIQFPTHLIEKEKELVYREFELELKEQRSKILINKIIKRNASHWITSIMWFSLGSILTALLILSLQ